MKHEILADGIEIYCGDCRDIMPTLPKFDACVTDPPYGIGESAGKNKSRGCAAKARDYGNLDWDNGTVDQTLINSCVNSSVSCILFGGNYYAMPPTTCWLIWDKLINGDFADCELAWTNLKKAVRRIQYRWNGMIRQNNEPRGDHPTQKPVGVMKWCISQLPDTAITIFDPFMGSGTTGVAAVKMGRKFTGIEREEKYYDIARRRIEDAMRQPDLLIPAPQPIPHQTDLF